ncbi:VapE domain-containing protein [Burkholderia ubonensis]|uniref:VapE domain-containing protein n=1 Tax=Burkholderia ubonensis TaxID=101571 RepID=UPI0009B4128E|nr:VapE domain-containing protein [Burkholderia ubonensis]
MPNSNVDGNSANEKDVPNQQYTVSSDKLAWGVESESDELIEAKRSVEESRARQAAVTAATEERATRARKEPDIVKRAASLALDIQFKDFKKVRQGDMYIQQPLITDENKWVILDKLFDEGKAEDSPHLDTYRGRYVDESGTVVDKRYPVVRWVRTFSAAGLKGVSAERARNALTEWIQQHERNSLIERLSKVIPEWDGVERCGTYLLDMFDVANTKENAECNREFGKYFWRSLYCRVMMPGALAPMVLCLFGGQGLGKSRFGNELSKAITGDPDSIAIQCDLDGDWIDFLRNITGKSVIAAIGETGGMDRSDWNKVKQRITLNADPLHYKFEQEYVQKRQFICIMDGNSYHGIQRDDTGNRRFKVYLCGQQRDEKGDKYLWDEKGQPVWRNGFVIPEEKWAAFRVDVWQLMAEAAHWIKSNGVAAYESFVQHTSQLVFEENAKERAANRGTSRNPDIETYGIEALYACPKKVIGNTNKRDEKPRIWIKWTDFVRSFKEKSGQRNPNQDSLRPFLMSKGGEVKVNDGYTGYVFAKYSSLGEINAAFNPDSIGDEYEVLEETPPIFKEN